MKRTIIKSIDLSTVRYRKFSFKKRFVLYELNFSELYERTYIEVMCELTQNSDYISTYEFIFWIH